MKIMGSFWSSKHENYGSKFFASEEPLSGAVRGALYAVTMGTPKLAPHRTHSAPGTTPDRARAIPRPRPFAGTPAATRKNEIHVV